MASPGCRRGQRGPRCSIHARRNLPDKAFGSLLLLLDLSFKKLRRVCLHKPPCIATGVGLYLNRLCDFWRIVSEDSRMRGLTFRFISQHRLAIFVRPSTVRCSFCSISSKIFLKISKSFLFFVCNGYCSKNEMTLELY